MSGLELKAHGTNSSFTHPGFPTEHIHPEQATVVCVFNTCEQGSEMPAALVMVAVGGGGVRREERVCNPQRTFQRPIADAAAPSETICVMSCELPGPTYLSSLPCWTVFCRQSDVFFCTRSAAAAVSARGFVFPEFIESR